MCFFFNFAKLKLKLIILRVIYTDRLTLFFYRKYTDTNGLKNIWFKKEKSGGEISDKKNYYYHIIASSILKNFYW